MNVSPEGISTSKWRTLIQRIETGFLFVLVVAIVTMAVIQIGLRNLMGTGIIWADILVRLLVLWIGMAGAMVGSRHGEHINIDLLSRHLPDALRGIVNAVIAWLTSGLCGIAAYYSVTFVIGEYQYGGNAFADIPVWVCQVIIPLGFAVIALRYFLLGIYYWRTPRATPHA